ncbi:MAG: nucleoside hydrolase, partial [Woeseiaceae bacterium]
MTDKVRVLLDTDANNEIDDQHAIAYLLLSGDNFVVEGLTVNRTDNGGDIEEQAKEAERVVQLCAMHPQLPVTRGASGSFDEIAPHLAESDFDGAEAVDLIVKRAHAASSRKLILLPIGKLTNVALALKKDPSIIDKVKVVWLGTNYPDPGEYNLDNDVAALNYVLDTQVEFEVAVVRYGAESGT